MKGRLFLLGGFLLAVLLPYESCAARQYEWKGGEWTAVAEPAEGTPEGELSLIRQHLQRGHNRTVVKLAERFLRVYPNVSGREEVMLLAGEAELNRRRYFQAFEWFNRQLQEYPSGRYSDRALDREFQVAEAFLAGEKRVVLGVLRVPARDDGVDILHRIAEQAPGSEIAERALLRVADYYYRRGDYVDAAEAYDHFIELFGKSTRLPYARLQAARAIYKTYSGPQWDETPLVETEQRLLEFRERYPMAAEKAGVEGMLRRIRELRAEKLEVIAEFYERTSHLRAAVFYHRRTLALYPDTSWAKQAEKDLRRLAATKATGWTRPGSTGTEGRARQ